ncbi:Putative COP9 signalosome subunit 6, MPN domain-containing protein [Septoria linicola]|uniref:COP9 signalosome complex subunit 6 n=1 Tax=Septoria linicola TaxID=215465 RepID=A0A9Q9AV53_9PEZI|nr:putative COP9 signalosome subunit 6, MPN domain-containing protein [Septoria linicola]USW52557.1 Putative COP9 signalosome subunit 6, MPN domain-containing protein [Septoria linicola]
MASRLNGAKHKHDLFRHYQSIPTPSRLRGGDSYRPPMDEVSLAIPGRPDTSLNVQLHPLVLLTMSDYITRHSIRQQDGPAVGAIIGQQTGRSFTLEFAFECKLAADTSHVQLDTDWFRTRLEMYKEVHKEPALDLVALFTTGRAGGPYPPHLPALNQAKYITGLDNILLLLFHPENVDDLQGGKLPISLFEAVEETEGKTKFKELAYDVETGDAERIGVDFVAKGSGSATAVAKTGADAAGAVSKDTKVKGKGKGKAKDDEGEATGTSTSVLSTEDDELISSLQAKVNAIKMLNERINLIRTYLTSQPESYLTDASTTAPPPDATNHQVLRSVNSMLSRLPLLAPPQSQHDADTLSSSNKLLQASQKEQQDVHLTSLLASLTRSVAEAQTLGTKFHIVQKERQNKERGPFGGNRGRGGFGDDTMFTNNGMDAN